MSSRVVHHLNHTWPQFWNPSNPEKTKKSRNWISSDKQNGKLQKCFIHGHTLFLPKIMVPLFSCDADKWFQIKSLWIWNVNLYKKDFYYSPIINNSTWKSSLQFIRKDTCYPWTCVWCIYSLHFHYSVHSYHWLTKPVLLIPDGWNAANFRVRFLIYIA